MGFFDSLLSGVTGALTGNPLGVVTGIGGLVTSAIGADGSKKAAEAQLQATRETNEQNYKIWQEQKEHNIDMFNMENQASIDMWNMQNEYNTPAAQAARLSGAGFNPYLALGGSNASGVASSAPQVGSISGASPPVMQTPDPSAFSSPWTYFAEQSVNSFAKLAQSVVPLAKVPSEIGLNDSGIGLNKSIQGLNEAKTWTETNYGWKLVREQFKSTQLSNEFFERTSKLQERQMEVNLISTTAAAIGNMINNDIQSIILQYLPAHQYFQILETGTRIANMQRQGQLLDLDLSTYYTRLFSQLAVDRSVVNANNAGARLDNANAYTRELHNRVTQAALTPEMAKELGNMYARMTKVQLAFSTLQYDNSRMETKWRNEALKDYYDGNHGSAWDIRAQHLFGGLLQAVPLVGAFNEPPPPQVYNYGDRYTTINN